MSDIRRQVGVVLRFPVVAFLGVLWVVYVWWWLAALLIGFVLAWLVLQYLAYWPMKTVLWLIAAFNNDDSSILPDYWDGYPEDVLSEIPQAVRIGFPTLRRWLVDGFSS